MANIQPLKVTNVNVNASLLINLSCVNNVLQYRSSCNKVFSNFRRLASDFAHQKQCYMYNKIKISRLGGIRINSTFVVWQTFKH